MPRFSVAQTMLSIWLSVFCFSVTAQDHPLHSDDAFRVEVSSLGTGMAMVSFDVAPGYYLYKDRISFYVKGWGARLGALTYPKSELINDPYFGDTPIYQGHQTILLPIQLASSALQVYLRVDYQGCSHAGICYPPLSKTVVLSE